MLSGRSGVRSLLARPRWVAWTALAVLATVGCGALAGWQYGRGYRATRSDPGALPVVAIERLLTPGQALRGPEIGRRVRADGHWDVQFLTPGRLRDGVRGLWVVTVLRLDAGRGPGIAVVRGWVPQAGDPAAVPARGAAEVSGVLQASEPLDGTAGVPDDGRALPYGQVRVVSAPDLLNRVGYDVVDGYLVATSVSPRATTEPLAVRPPVSGAVDSSLRWRNLSYAAQWVAFGCFTMLLWWRSLRDAVRVAREPEAGIAPEVSAVAEDDDVRAGVEMEEAAR